MRAAFTLLEQSRRFSCLLGDFRPGRTPGGAIRESTRQHQALLLRLLELLLLIHESHHVHQIGFLLDLVQY
jgi:hypothetical protein